MPASHTDAIEVLPTQTPHLHRQTFPLFFPYGLLLKKSVRLLPLIPCSVSSLHSLAGAFVHVFISLECDHP